MQSKIFHRVFKLLFIGLMTFALTFLTTASVFAFSAKPPPLVKSPNQWHFLLAPYAWLPWVAGNATVKGQDASIKTNPGDLIKALDAVFELRAEAAKGNWTLMADPTYIKLTESADIKGPFGRRTIGSADITFKMTLVDFGVYYKFLDTSINGEQNNTISLEALLGGRYMNLDNTLKPKRLPNVSGSKNWTDPIVGARLQCHINRYWSAVADGDIGGFGAGSHFTWAAKVMGLYHFNQYFGLGLGFRALGVNYSEGAGSNKFKMDTTMYGPVIGLTFRF